MTTPEPTSAPDFDVEPVEGNDVSEQARPAIPAFSFPFKPGQLAQARKDQPYYQKSDKSSHEKRPGAAPAGTRRSMGKR
jgi:hypothetical protein